MSLFTKNLFGEGKGSSTASWSRLLAQALLTRGRAGRTLCEAATPGSPPSLVRVERRHKSSSRPSRNGDGAAGDDTVAELVLQLAISVGLAVACGLLAQSIVRFTSGYLDNNDETGKNTPPASHITKRLTRILQKRAQTAAEQEAALQNNDGTTTTVTTSSKKKPPPKVTLPRLTSYELQMADNILDPDDIEASFQNVGGLDKTKEELYALAILPLLEPQLFAGSALVAPCKGILLYGPPGTGKTLLAKALAKEAAAVFLPLPLSTILNKWVGESNKLVAATFSLATKLQPAIIFVDELDTFLKANTQETAYLDTIKSEFLTWWDGVSTQSTAQVLVLGATNRPQQIDSAILRRMPRAFQIPLPNEAGRLAILQMMLQAEDVTPEARAQLPALASETSGYSGSDLKELCKTAAMTRIQERTHAFSQARTQGKTASLQAARSEPLRPIDVSDLKLALRKVPKTGEAAHRYGTEAAMDSYARRPTGPPQISMQDLAALLRQFSDLSVREDPLSRANTKESDSCHDDDEQEDVPDVSKSE